MPCLTSKDGSITICRPGPMERKSYGFERKRRWCFKCRKHVRHEKISLIEKLRYGMIDGKRELLNGYYDPVFCLDCPGCHEENIYFPGCEPL